MSRYSVSIGYGCLKPGLVVVHSLPDCPDASTSTSSSTSSSHPEHLHTCHHRLPVISRSHSDQLDLSDHRPARPLSALVRTRPKCSAKRPQSNVNVCLSPRPWPPPPHHPALLPDPHHPPLPPGPLDGRGSNNIHLEQDPELDLWY